MLPTQAKWFSETKSDELFPHLQKKLGSASSKHIENDKNVIAVLLATLHVDVFQFTSTQLKWVLVSYPHQYWCIYFMLLSCPSDLGNCTLLNTIAFILGIT